MESPLNIINPELQKMGKPVINPMIPNALAHLFSPVFKRINLAILIVPPVLSSVMPIIAPRIIKNPIVAIVLPNPSWIVLTIVFTGRTANARKSETRNSAIKASSFSLDVSIIIAIILIPTIIDTSKILINNIYVKNRYATNIAVTNPARSASNPQPIEYLVFFIPTEPKYTAII